jgi:hypothetical protein
MNGQRPPQNQTFTVQRLPTHRTINGQRPILPNRVMNEQRPTPPNRVMNEQRPAPPNRTMNGHRPPNRTMNGHRPPIASCELKTHYEKKGLSDAELSIVKRSSGLKIFFLFPFLGKYSFAH